MAEVIGQHQQSSFVDPQNGQVPIDADQVRSNDNALRVSFNSHDSDSGIHFQSVSAGSLPAAGTAGRKYLITDTLQVVYDNGASYAEVDYLNKTSGGTVAGAVVFSGGITGALTGNASTATALATGRDFAISGDITASAVSFDGTGNVTLVSAISAGAIVDADINASAAIADTKLATISTAGKVANSATTATDANTASAIVARDGSGNFSAGVITGTRLVNSGNTITLRGVTYTLPAADGTSGQVLSTNGSGVLSWAAASAGFVTGSGTSGKLSKWNSSSGLTDSIITESGSAISWTGTLSVSSSISTAQLINSGNTIGLRGVVYTLPSADGSNGTVLTTNGSGVLSWASAGGISGLTTGKLPKAASATSLTDSIITESGTTITVANTVNAVTQYNVNGTKVVGSRVTGFAKWSNSVSDKDLTGVDFTEIALSTAYDDAKGAIGAGFSFMMAMYDALVNHGLIGA